MVTWHRFVAETAIAACVFICLDGQAGETRDVRELKVAAFERRAVSVGLGGEFPGARILWGQTPWQHMATPWQQSCRRNLSGE
jgi:hypothetical protein